MMSSNSINIEGSSCFAGQALISSVGEEVYEVCHHGARCFKCPKKEPDREFLVLQGVRFAYRVHQVDFYSTRLISP